MFDLYQTLKGMRDLLLTIFVVLLAATYLQCVLSHGVQPLSRIAIQRAEFALHDEAFVKVSPSLLGLGVSFIQLAHLILGI